MSRMPTTVQMIPPRPTAVSCEVITANTPVAEYSILNLVPGATVPTPRNDPVGQVFEIPNRALEKIEADSVPPMCRIRDESRRICGESPANHREFKMCVITGLLGILALINPTAVS